jgi:hypothetical protein
MCPSTFHIHHFTTLCFDQPVLCYCLIFFCTLSRKCFKSLKVMLITPTNKTPQRHQISSKLLFALLKRFNRLYSVVLLHNNIGHSLKTIQRTCSNKQSDISIKVIQTYSLCIFFKSPGHLVFTNTYLETMRRIVWTLRYHTLLDGRNVQYVDKHPYQNM